MEKSVRCSIVIFIFFIFALFLGGTHQIGVAASENGTITEIVWDDHTEVKVSHQVKSAEYGRILVASDDVWLLGYQFGPYEDPAGGSRGDAWSSIALRRSVDAGKTWEEPFIIPVPKDFKGYWRFCNPEFIKLNNNRILLAYTGGGNPDTNENDVFFVRISDDLGLTWGEPKIVARGRGWEPAMIQLDDGTVQLFYSSEARWYPGPNLQQEILMVESKDNGETWSTDTPKRVAYNPGKRDGMPVPVVLQDHKGIAFVIESVGAKNSPYVIKSSIAENWNPEVDPVSGGPDDQHRWLATTDDIFGGAPYMTQLPSGETILSVHDKGYKERINDWKESVAMVYIGDNEARNFTNRSYPWPDLKQTEGAIQNAIYSLDNDRLLIVSAILKTDGNSEVWMKIGNIMRVGAESVEDPEEASDGNPVASQPGEKIADADHPPHRIWMMWVYLIAIVIVAAVLVRYILQRLRK